MSSIWIYVMRHVCLSGWQNVSLLKSVQPTFFIPAMLCFKLDSRSQQCEKVQTSATIILQSFQSMWMEFAILLRLAGVVNLTLIHSKFKGENPTYVILFKKKKKQQQTILTFSYIQTFTDQFLSNLVWWWKPLCSSVWMTLTFIQGHSCMRNRNQF